MARIARAVAVGIPHHVTQRGNRRQPTFFCDGDYQIYLSVMAEWCSRHGVEIWAYCLMPNHVHLIAIPSAEDSLRRAIGEAHRRYTRAINFREGWRGHLWQGRFSSYAMEEGYLLAAARYVEMNPVRAGFVQRPEEYGWSSAAAHLAGRDDVLVKVAPLQQLVGDWRAFLSEAGNEDGIMLLKRHERTGRPLGSQRFVVGLEKSLGRRLLRQPPGPKRKNGIRNERG
jgi:putative transposase